MRVLVVGGTGALGLPVVRVLAVAGHEVWVTCRGAARAEPAKAAGARTLTADLLDPAAVAGALRTAAPEVVVHAATALPAGGPQRWAQADSTNALRDRGSRILVDAAARQGVRRVVSQSFFGGYAPAADPGTLLTESAPFGAPAGSRRAGAAPAALAALEAHTRDSGLEGVVLRFGLFYGDPADTEALHRALRGRRLPLPGGARGSCSFVHVDDAAAAVVAAATQRAATGAYNVAEDRPRSFGDQVRDVAAAIGAPAPWTVPRALGRLVAPAAIEIICRHRPLYSGRIRAELGWTPTAAAQPNRRL